MSSSDDEHRENEGDVVLAASTVTDERAGGLDLPRLVAAAGG